jgi:hypothetical protein
MRRQKKNSGLGVKDENLQLPVSIPAKRFQARLSEFRGEIFAVGSAGTNLEAAQARATNSSLKCFG